MTVVRAAWAVVQREPVYLGNAVLGTYALSKPSAVAMAAAIGWVGWCVRLASRSKVSAAEDAELAKWQGAVEEAARRATP